MLNKVVFVIALLVICLCAFIFGLMILVMVFPVIETIPYSSLVVGFLIGTMLSMVVPWHRE
jgi:hypothetical protein